MKGMLYISFLFLVNLAFHSLVAKELRHIPLTPSPSSISPWPCRYLWLRTGQRQSVACWKW